MQRSEIKASQESCAQTFFGRCHGCRLILFVVITILGLPYLVDVAFYGDLTPTHFAQEVVADENIQNDDGDFSVPLLIDTLIVREMTLMQRPIRMASRLSTPTILPREYLISASLTSLPPPRL